MNSRHIKVSLGKINHYPIKQWFSTVRRSWGGLWTRELVWFYLYDGTPFETVVMVARADRYQYRITLDGRAKRKVIKLGEKGVF